MKFEVDHIIPRSRGGSNSYDNLALSCPICNLFKSDRETGVDPQELGTERLFRSREDIWQDHFAVEAETAEIVGITSKGRATVDRIQMNRSHQLNARRRWIRLGLFP